MEIKDRIYAEIYGHKTLCEVIAIWATNGIAHTIDVMRLSDEKCFRISGLSIHHEVAITKESAPIGSVWKTDTGNCWKVISHNGDYITVERQKNGCSTGDTYTWHITSITNAVRLS